MYHIALHSLSYCDSYLMDLLFQNISSKSTIIVESTRYQIARKYLFLIESLESKPNAFLAESVHGWLLRLEKYNISIKAPIRHKDLN